MDLIEGIYLIVSPFILAIWAAVILLLGYAVFKNLTKEDKYHD